LLAQVGAHAAAKFAERLAAIDLAPAHAGTLRIINVSSGISQQGLSSMLGLPPSRLVVLVDELEERGLVERRSSSEDRRVYALHLTKKGSETLEAISRIAREHDDSVCAALTAVERETLGALLRRIADEQGLTPGVHPGFSRLGRSPSKDDGAEGVTRRRKKRSGE
jgi:DNA-binding MarR family transcriptional regulator